MAQKTGTLCGTVKYEAKQFCLNTALHGYRFIVLPKRILLERIFWVIIVVVSLAAAITLLCIAWFNFQQNPTLLVTDSTHHPIWNYPFPAVTICSFNKISKTSLENLIKNLTKTGNSTSEELLEDFRLLFRLIYYSNEQVPEKDYEKVQDILDANNLSVEKVLAELATPCRSFLRRCKWKGEEKRCESIFEMIPTSDGYCCSFNYYALKNHTFAGVSNRSPPVKPRRVSACGYLTALEVLVNSEPDDYFATKISAVGHKVIVHDSYNFPDWNHQVLLTEKTIINLIGVTPTITYSTESIKGLASEKRKCKFSDEFALHNFYNNFHNCMTECHMNVTNELCGCIPFYYYNPKGTYPNQKICNLRDVNCLSRNKHLIASSMPGSDLTSALRFRDLNVEKNKCGCQPDCDYTDYSPEASSGVLTRQYSTNQLNLYGDTTIKDHSVIRVYWNDLVATKNRRDVSFSWHTLLAYYGGLLGLFIGFSFVSAVELIYFFTIRLFHDISKANHEEKNNKTEPLKVFSRPPNYEDLNPRKLIMIDDQFKLRFRSNSNTDS